MKRFGVLIGLIAILLIIGFLFLSQMRETEVAAKVTTHQSTKKPLFGALSNAQNTDQAVKWIRQTAEEGNAESQALMGGYYERGEGVPKDIDEAAKWYRKAMKQGHTQSRAALKKILENKKGSSDKKGSPGFIGGGGSGQADADIAVEPEVPPCEPVIHPRTKGYDIALSSFQSIPRQAPRELLQKISESMFTTMAMKADPCYRFGDHYAEFHFGVEEAYNQLYGITPSPPASFTAVYSSSLSKVKLNWHSEAIGVIKIERSIAGADSWGFTDTTTAADYTDPASSGSWDYRIQVSNSSGTSEYSQISTATVP